MPGWMSKGDGLVLQAGGTNSFPGFRDYNEAMRFPEQNFDDLELRHAVCILEDTRVGNNGRVYHFRCDSRDVAVKCFLNDQADRAERYERIKEALCAAALTPFVVDFDYLPRGLNINDSWYPILKMQWIDGTPVNQIPSFKLSEGLVSYLADQFMSMVLSFKKAGMAHGDLEFANLLVSGVDLKIVDYDGMFVPSLSRSGCTEPGHPGFQHPRRKLSDYAPHVDNFSAWLIHFLLRNMTLNPNLCELAAACLQEERRGTQEHLIRRGLENHPDSLVKQLGLLLKDLVDRPLHMIPDLSRDESLQSILSRTTKEVTRPGGGSLINRKPKLKP